MKTTKMNVLIALFCGMLLTVSCNDDDSPALFHAYGIAYPVEGESYPFTMNTDLGKVLIPTSSNYNIDTLCRVYATFSFVDEADYGKDSVLVDFKFMNKLLYKKITADSTDLGNSPVYVRKNNISQSKYNNVLNIPFEYEGGNETHRVNLWYNENASTADTLALEFRHNNNADPYSKRLSGLVCFDLNSISEHVNVTDSIVFKVSFNKGTTADFVSEWHGVYKP